MPNSCCFAPRRLPYSLVSRAAPHQAHIRTGAAGAAAGCSIALNLCLIVLASFQRYIEFHHTHEHAPDLEDTRSERLRRAGGWAVRGGNLLTQSDVAASIDHLHNAPPGPQHYADRAELTSGGQPALRPPHEFKTWQVRTRRI